MKILNAEQVRTADQHTIENEPIASVDLMERAATACFNWLNERATESGTADRPFHVVCGTGNNGGDGLVIARLLLDQGRNVKVWIARFSERTSPDFAINYDRLLAMNAAVTDIHNKTDIPDFEPHSFIVDALFGSGLTRPIEGFTADLVGAINRSQANVIAIDFPSGLFCEDNDNNPGPIVEASFTLTFEVPKLAFFLPGNARYLGHWELLPIGLDQAVIAATDTPFTATLMSDVAALVQPRARFSHKGTYGHALVMAGSYGKMGAAILAAQACLRSGAGLLTAQIPKIGYQIMQTSVPEAMTDVDAGLDELQQVKKNIGTYTAIGVGPGIGTHAATAQVIKVLIQQANCPVVFDADALNILAENKTWLAFLPPGCVLTPHPREFERLTEKVTGDYERLKQLRNFAVKNRCHVVLKGAHTAIASPDGQVAFNTSGNPGMATGGAGDVLTGVITGLLAQGYSAETACKLGVFMHGHAGDLMSDVVGQNAMIASDLVDGLGGAWQSLELYRESE